MAIGVTIGKVSQVLLRTESQAPSDYSIPVVMEFTPDLLTRRAQSQQQRAKADAGQLRATFERVLVRAGALPPPAPGGANAADG